MISRWVRGLRSLDINRINISHRGNLSRSPLLLYSTTTLYRREHMLCRLHTANYSAKLPLEIFNSWRPTLGKIRILMGFFFLFITSSDEAPKKLTLNNQTSIALYMAFRLLWKNLLLLADS